MTEIKRLPVTEMENRYHGLTAEQISAMSTAAIAEILEAQIGVLLNYVYVLDMLHGFGKTNKPEEITAPVTSLAINELKQRD